MKKKIIFSAFMFIVIGLIFVFIFQITEDFRAENYVNRFHFDGLTNKNAEIIEKVQIGGEFFYILVVDEYISNSFNSEKYYIVKTKNNSLGITTFEIIYSNYDGMHGSSFSNTYDGETYIFGLKGDYIYNTITVTLLSGEEVVLPVTDSPVLFYYTKDYLQIENIEYNITN